MALSVEASELMEIFQWVGAEESRKVVEHPDKLVQVEAEIADICIYAIRLAGVIGIDLETAIDQKIGQNIEKYPPNANRHWSF
jgi:NTP pyrophosphatase (non-canonical NTP hydrolase)